ncbi:MAG: extracellular solute-binding protein, partial [bacterium]|nr:extracellular solute-binding protein [bacterium]
AGLLFLVYLSCTNPGVVPASPTNNPSSVSDITNNSAGMEKEAWKVKWDHLIKEAKKEGVLAIYSTAGAEVRNGIARPLQEKFGLRLEYVSGKGAEISQRLNSERRAGIYLADIYIGGTSTLLNQLKPAGILDPLEPEMFLPEVLDPIVWYGGGIRWRDKDKSAISFLTYVIPPLVINTTLVSPNEIKSYRDLLNPKWKGKMIQNDPTVAGIGLTFFRIIGGQIMGYDYMKELVKQEPLILRDQRLQVEWVAQGKYAIAVAPTQEIVTYFKDSGAPLAYVLPVEGGWVAAGSGNIALVNRAPHPNAARLAINWLLTREAQIPIRKAMGVSSARLDVPTEGLDPATLIKPGIKYIAANSEEMELRAAEDKKLAEEIFGSLMK